MDKKPTIEELRRLADKLSKAVMAAGEPQKTQPVRDIIATADLAELARALSGRASEIGEPEASVLFRLASVQLSGNERQSRSEDLLRALSDFEKRAAS